jgi:hypothetical protein
MPYSCNADSLKACYNGWFIIWILWRVYPLLGNDSVNTFPREPTRATMGHPLLCNGSVNTLKTIWDNRRLCFPWGPPRGYITRNSKGGVSCYQKLREFSWRRVHLRDVVENLVEFWRWKSKVFEKKWQEMNQTAKRRLHVWFEVTDSYKSVARIRLMKTEKPSACVTVNCKVCRSAIALHCL